MAKLLLVLIRCDVKMNYIQLIITLLCAIIAIVPALMNRHDGRKDKAAEAKRLADTELRKHEFGDVKCMIEEFRDENRKYQENNLLMHTEIDRQLKDNSSRIDILDHSQQVLLRADIFQYYQFVMSRKDEDGNCFMTPSDEENIEAIYKCYKQLGGNGVGEKYYHAMMTLPTKG